MIFLIILAVLTGTTAAVLNHPSFGRAPRGERLERIGRSPNYRDGKFHNIRPTPITTAEKGGLSGIWHFLFGKRRDLKPENDLPTVKTDLHGLDPERRNGRMVRAFVLFLSRAAAIGSSSIRY